MPFSGLGAQRGSLKSLRMVKIIFFSLHFLFMLSPLCSKIPCLTLNNLKKQEVFGPNSKTYFNINSSTQPSVQMRVNKEDERLFKPGR